MHLFTEGNFLAEKIQVENIIFCTLTLYNWLVLIEVQR